MSKEQEKSEALIEEDELEYAEGRDKILGQEQRAALDRVERMKRMREQAIDNMKSKTTSATHARKEHAMKIDDDSSDDDVDELDDWRSKAF
ncbi:hypothetical protein SARC_01831 [Sphaeroforma arctica JP610]|uniref:Uncharacterized protein n=1 Tax=Sphaeroforma arctica JP610 TaxID=667725 RepID=A0A0L0GAV9_9EUKA|nr:hypothetical protein SARC_01831 [Sphaeroforma arctica JP610]KNC86031.1 hypothetical protein SARC_01831 [Sphaeroforma arctica JP610]|eukprot:XP_014159933.1 hypothetical protein SARC_01831 [Sphaeroforma arctica JP610]